MSIPVLRAGQRQFPARLALVDLDGTLVDTAPDIARAVDATAADLGMSPPGEAQVRGWVGDGARRLVERMLVNGAGGVPESLEVDRAHGLFLEHYRLNLVVDSRPMPGAQALLARLREAGIHIACVTNKPEILARGVLAGLELDGPVEWLVGGDSLETRKPDPGPLRHVAENTGFSARESVVIGDSEVDVAAARSFGAGVICLRCGYNRGFTEPDSRPDAFVDSLSEIETETGG